MKRDPSAVVLLERVLAAESLSHFTGSEEFRSLLPFIQGVAYGLNAAGVYDAKYQSFLNWLRVRGMCPPNGGWTQFFLRAAEGDDRKAQSEFAKALAQFLIDDPT
jgi:hypothetical protein